MLLNTAPTQLDGSKVPRASGRVQPSSVAMPENFSSCFISSRLSSNAGRPRAVTVPGVLPPGPTSAVPPTVDVQPATPRHTAQAETAMMPSRRISQGYGWTRAPKFGNSLACRAGVDRSAAGEFGPGGCQRVVPHQQCPGLELGRFGDIPGHQRGGGGLGL